MILPPGSFLTKVSGLPVKALFNCIKDSAPTPDLPALRLNFISLVSAFPWARGIFSNLALSWNVAPYTSSSPSSPRTRHALGSLCVTGARAGSSRWHGPPAGWWARLRAVLLPAPRPCTLEVRGADLDRRAFSQRQACIPAVPLSPAKVSFLLPLLGEERFSLRNKIGSERASLSLRPTPAPCRGLPHPHRWAPHHGFNDPVHQCSFDPCGSGALGWCLCPGLRLTGSWRPQPYKHTNSTLSTPKSNRITRKFSHHLCINKYEVCIILFFELFFNSSIVNLQYYVSFRCTT